VVVTTAHDSYASLIDALENGNAHIVLLDPLSYSLAYQKELVQARFATIEEGKYKYGAQFLAALRDGYTPHFSPSTGQNTSDADFSLAQFQDKKPCWSEDTSPSGYVVPLGVLNQSQVFTLPPAFVGGQPTVVRSLYVGGICDFGATYIDARKFPSLEDQMPDLLEQVAVIWEIPDTIPYGVLAFSNQMPQHMHDLFASLIPAIMQTDAGKAAFKTAFDIEELQAVNDGDFADFHSYVRDSRVDIFQLLDQ
jgi:phosphonate transport system substrate-binding protein